ARLLGGGDPTGVHVAILTITVLAGPDLVLPFFEVAPPAPAAAGAGLAPRSSGPTTLLALQNLADEAVRVRLDVLSAAGEPLAIDERLTLCPREVRTVNLRYLPELAAAGERGATGYAQVARIGPAGDATGCPPPAEPPGEAPAPPLAALAGDFLRLDPERGWASGGPLLATDPERVPRELCRRWSTRFSQAPPFGDDTELLFWVGENPGEVQPVARGRIYDDGGNPVAEVALHSPDHVFASRASELALAVPVSPPVLLTSGTIEWRFPPGVRGHVSTVRESFQGDAAAVPGICLDPLPEGVEPRGREGPLVLPFVDLPVGVSADLFGFPFDPGGETVRLTVRNRSARAALVELRYFDAAGGCVVFSEQSVLPAGGAQAIDLHAHLRHGFNEFCPWQESFGRVTGYVEVQEVPIVDQNARLVYRSDLSADFVRISPDGAEAAGGSLIDTGPGLAPPQICRRWSTRLLHGPEAETELTFYMGGEEENPLVGDPLSVTGAFRDETGDCLRDSPDEPCREDLQLSRSAAVFRLTSSDPELGLGATEFFGTVEWTFPDDRPGHVTTRFRSPGSFAAQIPGICLEP
ncbi:MAG TPA: hypothetical protein VJG13_10355, partial [Thermoanaerobaculia bacterium]|nr:hypothetical protein [Thermoanaerobaculia bacterium]